MTLEAIADQEATPPAAAAAAGGSPSAAVAGGEPPPGAAGDAGRLAWMCERLAVWVVAPPPQPPPAWPAAAWEDFRAATQVHGVGPLLGRRLGDRQPWSQAAAWLGAEHAANRLRVERLHQDLRAILARFAAADVPLMPLKGAVLGPLYYSDPAERPMADLDLLVRAETLAQSAQLLVDIGYEVVFEGRKHVKLAPRGGRRRPVSDAGGASDGDVGADAGGSPGPGPGDHEAAGEHPDNPRWVELHPACGEWLGDERIDLTGPIWAGARRQPLLGEPAWLPDPATHWLYLLVHATHHILINRFRLIQLLDLLLLCPTDLLGAALQVEPPAAAAAMARALYPPLALLQRYFPAGATAAATALRQDLRARLAPGYAAWADGLDLFQACYLDAAPWRAP